MSIRILWPLLLISCTIENEHAITTEDSAPPLEEADADADTDSDTDSDTDADTDADTDTEKEPCPGLRAEITTQADVTAYAPCVELDTIYLHITSKVTDLTLPNLESVKEDVYLHANKGVETVSMPVLESVGGYLYLYQNPEMTSASFPLLESVGEYLYADTNLSLETLDLTTNLTSVGESIYIAGNALLCVPELDWESIATEEVNIFSNAKCP